MWLCVQKRPLPQICGAIPFLVDVADSSKLELRSRRILGGIDERDDQGIEQNLLARCHWSAIF